MIHASKRNEFNRGCAMENKAHDIFSELYDSVQQTSYSEFYDYLVTMGTMKIFIEVKWVECKANKASVILKWNQVIRLINTKDFLMYVMTSKGNIFITPNQFFEYAHIHHMDRSINDKHFVISINFSSGEGILENPAYCPSHFCLGKISDNKDIPLKLVSMTGVNSHEQLLNWHRPKLVKDKSVT